MLAERAKEVEMQKKHDGGHHHGMGEGHLGPRMPEHEAVKLEPVRNKVQHVHAEVHGAGPRMPDHDVEEDKEGKDKSDQEESTRARKKERNAEEVENLANTIQLTQKLKLESASQSDDVLSVEKLLEEKVGDSQTRDYLKLMMKQHIFPKPERKRGGRLISDKPKDESDEEQAKEDEVFKSIEMEAGEFLALINMIIRDEKIHMSDEYFVKVQQKVMDNAQKSVDFATRHFGVDIDKEGKKSLKEWVREFIRFHSPIVHDEN